MPVLGLVSDTHIPQRCDALPAGLFEALRGVDLLLHAGDVGELWVLDRLGAIAPVVAVHGNDDSADAQRELPYQRVVVAGGTRVLLCHCHHPDREQEMAGRRSDELAPKLARLARLTAGAGAAVLVFGHWHIPLAREVDGVLLVNPGAIGTPNATTRQLRRSVARLRLEPGRPPLVEHVDLADPARVFRPDLDLTAGFRANALRFSASILDPALGERWDALRRALPELVPPEVGQEVVLRVARRVWRGEQEWITLADLLAELEAEPRVPAEVAGRLRELAPARPVADGV
ncbi:MAG TPA: YfcE family phosphodiesterase [Chloroflexota bacterium]